MSTAIAIDAIGSAASNPVRHDDEGGDDHERRADEVAEHLEVGAAQVDRVLRAAAQHEHRREVGQEAQHRDDEHRHALHLVRLALGARHEPPDGRDGHRHRDDEQDHAVHEGAEHLGPPVPVGLPVGRRPRRDHRRDERDDEADEVARHVTGVGEQGERAAEDAADDLHDEERADDRDRDPDPGAVRGRPVGVRVVVGVCHPLQRRRGSRDDAVMGMSRVLSRGPVRKPSRQLGYRGSHPSSRLAFAFDDPRILVISDTPCSPMSGRATHAGTCRGGLAPMMRASSGSHSETGAGSSSTML